jgi:hypothetical protein
MSSDKDLNLHNIEFIANNLYKYKDNLNIKVETGLDTVCAFTGKPITEGIPKSKLIKKTFTDHSYLKYNSKYCSIPSALCISNIIPNKNGILTSLRNYSYIVTEKDLKFLDRPGVLNYILNPYDGKFILNFTYSNKKHTAYKSALNTNKEIIKVTTDKGNVLISVGEFKEVYKVAQDWYTVKPGKEKTEQTFFTKSEINIGVTNYKKIESYGFKKFYKENELLSKYRGSDMLTLLTTLISKETKNDKN